MRANPSMKLQCTNKNKEERTAWAASLWRSVHSNFDSASSIASVLSLAGALNKLDDAVRYLFAEAVDSVCARVCVRVGVLFAARSKGLLKESINWATVWELRWLWWAVGWWKERPGGGRKWGGSDEVTTSAVKFCQEVCVWANGLAEEVLSQEAWPRERPVELASPPRAHVTALHKVALGWRHNTPFPGPAPCARVCTTGLRAHTRLLCVHSSVNTEMRCQIPVAQ